MANPSAFAVRSSVCIFSRNAAAGPPEAFPASSSFRAFSAPRIFMSCRGRESLIRATTNESNSRRSRFRRDDTDDDDDLQDDVDEEELEEEVDPGQATLEENLEIIFRLAVKHFHKYSSRVIRASRQILPPAISTDLIAFGVKGSFILGALWIIRVLLEVCCSVSTYVFVGLLVVRSIWSIVVSLQPSEDSTWSPRGT